MTLCSIELENYKKYPKYTLEFEYGLTGIIGRNGSGKSTIFDAIIFALYGELRGQKDNLKYSKAGEKENVRVCLVFEVENKSYKVVRELRGKSQVAKAYLYDEDDSFLSEGAKEVSKNISKILKMSRDAFMHTVFASQKELTALSGLKNEDRKKIIRKLLGLEKIDKIEQEIRSKLTDLNRDIKSFKEILLSQEQEKQILEDKKIKEEEEKNVSKEIDAVSKSLKTKSEELQELYKELQKVQKLKEEHTKLHSELYLFEQKMNNQSKNLNSQNERLKELNTQFELYEKEKALIDEYNELTSKIDKLQKDAVAFQKREGLEKEQDTLRDEYKRVNKEIKELKQKLEAKLPLMQKEKEQTTLYIKIENEIAELEKRERTLRAEIAKYNGLMEDTRQKLVKIESLGKGSNCPTCTRPLLEAYDEVIYSLQANIETIHAQEVDKREKELNSLLDSKSKEQEKRHLLEKALQDMRSEISVLSSLELTLQKKEEDFKYISEKGINNKKELEKLENISYDENAHTQAIKSKQKIEARYKELIGIARLIEQIPALQKEVKAIKEQMNQTQAEIDKQKRALKEHTYDAALHEKQVKLYDEGIKEKDEIASLLREKDKSLGVIKVEVKALEGKLETNQKQKKLLQAKLDDRNDYEKLKLFMGEFKNKINSKISPRISQLASEMYSTITKGKYQHIEVSNEFDFFIYDDGVRYSIERFSGGEVDLANLVLRIAISKTLSELNGSSGVGFLAFDEVFGSQDEERRTEIMEAFHTIKEQYRQIFLISHESEIKEMFERVVEL